MSSYKGLGAKAETIRRLCDGLSDYSTEAVRAAISQSTLNKDLIEGILKSKGLTGETLKTTTAELANATATNAMSKSQEKATGSTSGLKYAMEGLGNSIKKAWTGFISNPFAIAVTAGAVALGVATIAAYKYATAFDKASEAAQESQNVYAETANEVASLNSEYETAKDRIKELDELKRSGTISVDEDIELQKLKAQNEQLENKIRLTKELADEQSAVAVDDAVEALNLKRFNDYSTGYTRTDKTGMVTTVDYQQTDLITATESNIKELEKLKRKQKEVLADKTATQAEIDEINSQVNSMTENVKSNINEMESLKSNFQDPVTGLMKSSLSADTVKMYERMVSAIDDFNTIDLSPVEKQLSKIETFFDGSTKTNAIKDRLLEVAKTSDSTSVLITELERMGLTIEDLGLSGAIGINTLTRYFNELADSVVEAEDAINSVDGTVAGVSAAFEKANDDANWISMAENLSSAIDLYKKGKVGTDDFKTSVQFMTYDVIDPDAKNADGTNKWKYDADAYVEYWKEAQKKVKRYFDEENPLQSIKNFSNDLVKEGLAKKVGDEYIWAFDTSAQAAEKLGISISAVETLMKSLESYGAEFGDVMFSGEGLSRYEVALNGLKAIRDEMADGASKTRMSSIIDGWDAEFAKYQDDISLLSEDIIVEIEFEYSLAQIQSEIDELQRLADEGDSTAKSALNAKKSTYRDKLEAKTGFDESDSASYKAYSDMVSKLQDDLETAKEENKDEIKDQISAIYDLQGAYQDYLNNGGEMDWEEFLNTDTAKALIDEIGTKLVGLDNSEISVKFAMNDFETAKAEIESMKNGTTITFKAEMNGVETEITAVKDVDGKISYKTILEDGSTQWLVAVKNQDGTVTYEPITEALETTDYDQDGFVVYEGIFPKKAPKIYGYAEYDVTYRTDGSLPSENIRQRFSGTMLSPAHKDGTAYNVINTIPISAYGNGKVGLPKDERALVNELGMESIVRDGVWRLIPGGAHLENLKRGDIVFSASQTRDLLKNGKTPGHARAYAQGTLLSNAYDSEANGWRLPSGKDTTVKTSSKSTKAVEKALEAIDKYFDWIEVRFERLARLSENAVDAIDRATTLSKKLSASTKAVDAIEKEITASQKAAKEYLAQAKSIAKQTGLSESIQKKVRNGTIDIGSYSEKTQEKISAYKNYYDKYLESLDQIKEKQDEQKEIELERLNLIKDSYEIAQSVHESSKNLFDSRLQLQEAKGYSMVSDSVKELYNSQIDELQSIYSSQVAERKAYEAELNRQLEKGTLKKSDDAYKEAIAEINEMRASANETTIEIWEMRDALRELEVERIQNFIDALDRAAEKLENQIDLMEARDEDIPESMYHEQIANNNERIAKYNEQIKELKAQQAEFEFGSEQYNDLADQIADAENASYDLLIQNEELQDSIAESRFANFEEDMEAIEDLKSEVEDLRGLLDEEAFFDKDGGLTDEGLANIALIEQEIIASKQAIADYNEALDKLDEAYANGIISEDEYNEKSKEYRQAIRDNAKEVKNYEDALIDLYLTQVEKENEALKEVIDLRKEALQRKKSYYDYDKTISAKSKDINMLKAQIAAMEGSNDKAAQAELKRLKQELRDAQDDLEETKRQHDLEMQEAGYDQMVEDLDEMLEDTEYAIRHNAEVQEQIIDEMLGHVVDKYDTAYDTINAKIEETGLRVSETLEKNLEDLNTATGALDQANKATQNQSSVTPSGSASGIDSSGYQSSADVNSKYEQDLAVKEDITNRKVASIKLSASSVSVIEGTSKKVTVEEIKPIDAANQNVKWTSSDTKIATVSGGSIKGVAVGSCTITCTAEDGNGATATVSVTVTGKSLVDDPKLNTGVADTNVDTKEEPKKPSSGGGDNKITKGEKVTFDNGKYTASSDGSGASGKQNLGGKVYVTKINSGAERPYHISKDKSGDSPLGWVKKKQLSGYAQGSKYIDEDQLAWLNEYGNIESYIRQRDGAILRVMGEGDRIMNPKATANLYDMANDPTKYFAQNIGLEKLSAISAVRDFSGGSITNHYDTLLTVNGNVDKDALPGLEEILKKSYQYTSEHMYKDAVKLGFRKR